MLSANTQVPYACVERFDELKLGKEGIKYIVYKIDNTDPKNPVVTMESELKKVPGVSDRETWKELCTLLESAKSKDKNGKEVSGPRCVAYDFDYQLKDGEGQRKKLALIGYCPEDAIPYWNMLHSGTFGILKSALNAANSVQTNSMAELEYDEVLQRVDPKADLGGD
jgi:cofilin